MACRPHGTKPLIQPMLIYQQPAMGWYYTESCRQTNFDFNGDEYHLWTWFICTNYAKHTRLTPWCLTMKAYHVSKMGSRLSERVAWCPFGAKPLPEPMLTYGSKLSAFCNHHIDGLAQERHNSIANALELPLPCTKPSICYAPQSFTESCHCANFFVTGGSLRYYK